MEECFRSTMWQENSYRIERKSISHGSQANFTLWSRMLANQENSSSDVNGSKVGNQENSSPDVSGSRDENNSMDVWIY